MKYRLLLPLFFVTILLAAKKPADIIVDQQGNGHFRTVQQAIDSVRAFNPAGIVTILIKKGIYKEKLLLQSYTCRVHLIGEDRDSTVLTFDDGAKTNNLGTFRSYSFKIAGNDITLENLTVENSANPKLGQAVALHLEGDRLIFINCRFLGNQDTIYTGKENARHYFYQCYIEGTTDFIFGPSTVWFESCTIFCKSNSYITAASTPEIITYGYIFNNCLIQTDEKVKTVYLGRPWRPYAMTLFMHCQLPAAIRVEGWHNWGKVENEKTARYLEYANSGEGSAITGRVKWSKVLSKSAARKINIRHVLGGYDHWNPQIREN